MSPKVAVAAVVGVVAAVAIGVATLDSKPDARCMKRPAGVAVGLCAKVCGMRPDGKTQPGPCDPGDDNVMQPGQWVDRGGCVESPCSVVFK